MSFINKSETEFQIPKQIIPHIIITLTMLT